MVKKHLSRLLSVLVAAALAFASLPLEAVYAAGASDSNGSPTLQDAVNSHLQSFESYAADDEVEFIVELEGKSLLETKSQNVTLQSFLNTAKGEAAVNSIEKEQASVEQKMMITRSSGLEIEFTYKTVLNGFAVRAKYSEKERLESIPGVKNVYVAAMHEYVEPVDGYTQATHTSGALMDSDRANAEGYTGKGTVTAILDTGLDVNHSAFANAPEDPRYTQDDVAQIVAEGELNATGDVSALYKSEKIPFAYDYADKDNDVADSEGHGTHVTGSVGADSAALTGVAPDTQLMMMKVFSDVQSGASDTWILAALEDCVLLDVDAINMSLGSAAGFTESDELTNQVYERVEAEGLNLLCAAGNDTSSAYSNLLGTDMNLITNPDNGVVGSPSTYNAALSVASINEESVYSVYFMAGGNKIKFNDSAASDDLKFEKALDGQTLEYVQVPNFGDEYDFDEVDVRGKIALVERGSIAFTEKEQNAYDAGAAGVIVYDNEEGELPNMQVNGLLPMIIVTKADGQFLRGLEDKTITVSEDFAEDMPDAQGGLMSDFSSLGVSPDLSLKPEITAPGGNVYSTLPGDTFGNMSGTSMASPHMAGAAAVMKQYVNETFPELSATEKQQLINQLMMSTAVPVQDEDGVYYTPRKQGAGLAQIYNAIHTGAYLTVEGCDRPKAELKDNENGTFSFTFTVHNMTDQALSYNLSAVPLTAKAETLYGYRCVSESSRVLPESEFTVSFSGDTVNVPANGTATVTVNMQLTEEGKQQLAEFTNGTFLDGFVMLDSNNEDGIDLSLPYLGFYGDWADAPIFDETLYDDGEASSYDMSGLYLINYADYTGYPLGINMITADMESASADKIAVASRSLGYYRVTPVLGMLRNSKEMTYTVTNQDGEVVFTGTGYNAPKSYYYANGDFFTYHLPSTDLWWKPIYDGGDGYYYYLPDGDYTYTVTGRVDGEEETQSISFPIEIDNTAPEVTSHRYYEENGTPYLEVTVQDNHYIMAAQLVDTNDEPLSDIIATESQEAGGAVTYTFDLTAARASGVNLGKVLILDYAQNMTESPVYSLISQNIDPMEVQISQQDLHFSLGTAPFQLTAVVYPEEAENKTITWSSDDPSVAAVSETGVMTTVGAGTTTIRATAYNGVQGTTTVTVVAPTTTFPEDFVIREDGRYVIPADLNREVTITDNAHNVTLVGNTANTKENPYEGLSFVSENTDLNLTIENLNVNADSSKPVISFKGTGNTLVLSGENTLSNASYSARALILVPQDGDVTVKGSGTLNLQLAAGSYGAGIGGNTSAPAGTITIDGGVINGTSYGAGALIGGAGSSNGGATVVVNGGTLDLNLLLNSGYNNSASCGAGIGGGSFASSSNAQVSVTINGGTITGRTDIGASVIGTGYGSSVRPNITINGGKIDVAATGDGAAIGTGSRQVYNDFAPARVTVNGGEVIASASGNGAAIGGGYGIGGSIVFVNGGTVTASATGAGAAIGDGGSSDTGSVGTLRISAGSVKATASNTGTAISDQSVDNNNSDRVFETLVYAPNVKNVTIDGVDWKVSENHPDDNNLHLWLAAGTHDIQVTTEDGTLKYEAVVTPTGRVTVRQYFNVTYVLTGLETNGADKVYAGETLSGTLTAQDDKHLPESITVTMGGETVTAEYSQETGAFSVANVTGDIILTASASEIPVDKSALAAAIAEAEALVQDDYTSDSWSAFAEELADAKAVLADDDATQQAVNDAAAALESAMEALVERGDKTALEALIDEAEALKEADYTADTWAAFEEALNAAQEVAADADALQGEIDDAAEALESAMEALVERGDKTALEALIDEAEALKEADYTADTWAAFEEALNAAQEVAADADALQGEIDDAADALRAAMDALTANSDKSALEELISEAENMQQDSYTADSWSKLEEALDAAKATAADKGATQAEVDAAAEALRAAIDGLEKVQVTPPETTDPEKPSPDTGDNTAVAVPLVLVLAAGACAVVFFKRKKSAR